MTKPLIFIIILLIFNTLSQGQDYPVTKKTTVLDTIFGEEIRDDYRWLENLDAAEVEEWVSQQNEYTVKALKKAAQKENSLVAIDKYSYLEYSNPQKQGDYYFTFGFYNNVGVPALFYQTALREDPHILVDPNFISQKDNIRINGIKISADSRFLAFTFSRNGSDWQEIMVVRTSTGQILDDHLADVKFSNIAWKGEGFYYSKFPHSAMEKTSNQEVYFHRLGDDQSIDKLIFRRPKNPDAFFSFQTTTNERFFILEEEDENSGERNIFFIDFNDSLSALRPLLTRLSEKENINIIDEKEGKLIAVSYKDGNNGMLVKIDPVNPRAWQVIIPDYKSALLLDVKLMKEVIIAVYQSNRKQQIIFYDYTGKVLQAIQLPFGFSCSGFNGNSDDKEITFSLSSYTQPPIVYVLDLSNFKMQPLSATVVNFDYSQFETKELEYYSFDSTLVPLFIIYKKGTDISNPNPLLLKAYGGFGAIVKPGFDPGLVHFLMRGGVFAFANIRGGGDKGSEWADMGRGINKVNSFGDFISAAEYLIREGYTSSDKLAITGASNGGLTVGVAMTWRPDLFRVAVPEVAPFDMIRFENFTIGNYHTDEYGSVTDSAGFTSIKFYSPYQNIKDEIDYPATLILTSENDDRVPPFHSYKFAARLQNRQSQTHQVLLRVEESAGHRGATRSFKSQLQEQADMYDFILYHLMQD